MRELNTEREEYLIAKIKNGDYELFGDLIQAYQSSLYSFINRIVRNRDDTLDITQETFFKAYRAINSFRFKSKFSTWLFRIGYNEAINFIKKYIRHREIEKSITSISATDDHITRAEKDEVGEEVGKLLHKLREEQRIALHLLYKEEKSYIEIAEIMEIPLNTVKSHIRRGKDALKQKLSEIYDPETILA